MRDSVLIGSGWIAGSIVTGANLSFFVSCLVAIGCGVGISLIILAYDHWIMA